MGFEFEINGEDRVPGFLKNNRVGPDGEQLPPSKCQIASRVVSSMIGLAIAIFMIYLGATRKDECPAEPMVPTFLIVSGSMTIVSSFLGFLGFLALLATVKKKMKSLVMFMQLAVVTWLQSLVGIFSLIWFIVGSVYTFKAYEPDYIHDRLPTYCDEGLYKFTFYALLISYGIMAVAIGISCLVCVCACCAGGIAACFKK